jgi:hypothetical protein
MLGSIALLCQKFVWLRQQIYEQFTVSNKPLLNIDKSIAKPWLLPLNLTWCREKVVVHFYSLDSTCLLFVFARFGKVPRKASKETGQAKQLTLNRNPLDSLFGIK